MKNLKNLRIALAFIALQINSSSLLAQCGIYPVSLEQRANQSAFIVAGTVQEKQSYLDPRTGNVYTSNKIQVNAWLKNHQNMSEIYLITEGGVIGDRATLVYPSLQVEPGQEYVFFLEANNESLDNKSIRARQPGVLQARAYADGQGALLNHGNVYTDLIAEPVQTEASLFSRIAGMTGESARRPTGEVFNARNVIQPNVNGRIDAITSFSPSPTNAGTIAPADFITITGSGFGAAAGTVFFTNADDGGSTFTSSGIASDIVSWSDASITVKVARRAGTGPINVNGAFTSATNLTIDYAHLDINSNFSGFGSSTRQRYYLRNLNGSGGYTFLYNTAFNTNAPAVAAFERALETWRCNGGVNFISGGTTATASVANDGVNAVFFDATLPVGVLGRATSQFSGSANGLCNLANTVWYTADVDVQFMPDPPVAGFTWEYGPALPGGTEFDFESVSVHELGHALGLGHRIASGEVMHYAVTNGVANRTPSGTEISGANAKMAYSTAATCFDPAGSGTPMTTASCSTLPITLLDFTGQKNRQQIDLNWNTSQEQNALHFELEKSTDGNRFYALGKIQAAGNSIIRRDYSYIDRQVTELNYYRLKMVDIDGHYEYSRTILVRDPSATQQVWVLNNPFHSVLDIRLAKQAAGPVQFELIGLNGAKVYSGRQSGGDNFSLDLSGSTLQKGVYILQTKIGGVLFTNKIVHQ